jgi:RNA polymerase sigma-70 factor, ECF subfamily
MNDANGLVDHLFRERAGQMVAWLTRVFGASHLDLVEEVVQDALVKALQQWPYSGVPTNPAGWLCQVARNGALDVLRRDVSFRNRAAAIAAELTRSMPDHASEADPVLEDDELKMIFLCCHPALATDTRVALSLKTVSGFSVQEIARAFLTSEATIAQRLVRAKRRLRDLEVPFDLPSDANLSSRLDSVLEVIYLLFNEGYAARSGDALVRSDLCSEALRLARLVAGSARTETPAAHALAALIALQTARRSSRIDDQGEIVLLEAQDRSRWDAGLIALGFAHLERSAAGSVMTVYHVQAAIAAAHTSAAGPQHTPWADILRLYDDLVALNPSPLVRLNRIVALWQVEGHGAALAALRPLKTEPALQNYYLLPALEGRLLASTGDRNAACRAFEAALTLPCSEPEQRFLRRQIRELQGPR